MSRSLILTPFILILGLIVQVGGSLQAMELGELFSRTTRYELQTKKILQDRLEAVIPKTHFILSVDAELFTFYNVEKPIENPDVFLGKLGLAEPIEKKRIEKYRIAKPNFFSNISALRVKLIVDESIPHSKIDDAQLIVHNMVPDINRQKIKFESGRMVVVEKSFWTRVENGFTFLAEWSARNRYALGLILLLTFASAASLLFYVFVKRSGRTLENLTHRFLGVIEKSIDRPTTIINSPAGMIPLGSINPANLGKENNTAGDSPKKESPIPPELMNELAVFTKVFEARPVKIASMVKSWLVQEQEKGPAAHYAMGLLFELLEREQLASVMRLLPDEDQQSWMKKRIDMKNTTQVQSAIAFLKIETLYAGLFRSGESEEEDIATLILGLTNQEIVGCAKRDPGLTSLMIKGLPERQIKAVFELMPKALVSQVIEKSLSSPVVLEPHTYARCVRQVVAQVRQEKERQIPTTFLKYLIEQISTVGFAREKEILAMFRKDGRHEVLLQLAKEVFPSELIPELPADIIKEIAVEIPFDLKIEWSFALDQQAREHLFSLWAENGSRERDYLETEFRKSTPPKNADEAWSKVAQVVRRYLKNNPQAKERSDFMVELWVYGGKSLRWNTEDDGHGFKKAG